MHDLRRSVLRLAGILLAWNLSSRSPLGARRGVGALTIEAGKISKSLDDLRDGFRHLAKIRESLDGIEADLDGTDGGVRGEEYEDGGLIAELRSAKDGVGQSTEHSNAAAG